MHEPEATDPAADVEPDLAACDDTRGNVISSEEWSHWMKADLKACAAYKAHAALLDRCCEIACSWRVRFWERKALWGRIRRGRRLAKELAEVAPVLQWVLNEVDALTLVPGAPRLVILDLCSGFGYLAMFLSELLPASKVERIVLVDKMWAPQNVAPQSHHIPPDHILDPGWPIPLTTSRVDLKTPSDRRSLVKHFLSNGSPAMLLGVHLCGTLSLRCIELFNDAPTFGYLALKPCCLPDMLFAKRGDVFGHPGGHCFPAQAVCAHGKWNKGKWVNGASRTELEKKFRSWVSNLSLCVECAPDAPEGSEVRTEHHLVQEKWFLNDFIFARRPWSTQPPRSAAYTHADQATASDSPVEGAPRLLNMSNSSGVTDLRRKEILEEWHAGRREEKRMRRLANRTPEQIAAAQAKIYERRGRVLRAQIEVLSSHTVNLQLFVEVHESRWVRFGRA